MFNTFNKTIKSINDEINDLKNEANLICESAKDAIDDLEFDENRLLKKINQLEKYVEEKSIYGKEFWRNKLDRWNKQLLINNSESKTICS